MNTMQSSPSVQHGSEHLFKVVVIGESSTGKTSFIKRSVYNLFISDYRATIGIDFALKVVNYDDSTLIRLQLWDIAGQERFGSMTRAYYKDAVGAFLVYDVNREKTLHSLLKWKSDLDSKVSLSDGSTIPCLLLANKCDLIEEATEDYDEMLREFVRKNDFIGYLYTSPKENINIEEAVQMLIMDIMKRRQNLVEDDIDKHDTIVMTDYFNRNLPLSQTTNRQGQAHTSSCC